MDTIYNDKGCFYRALDDEPVFVLLARDPCTPEAIRHWVTLRQALIGRGEKPLEDHEMLGDAIATASAANVWRSDATDPAKWGPGTKRWQVEPAPARELVETGEIDRLRARIAELEETISSATHHTVSTIKSLMPMPSVEDLARAIHHDGASDKQWDDLGPTGQGRYLGYATSALNAIHGIKPYDVTKPDPQDLSLAMVVLRRYRDGEGPLAPGDAGRIMEAIWRTVEGEAGDPRLSNEWKARAAEADRLEKAVSRSPEEGEPEVLLLKALLGFDDEATMTIYAGTVRRCFASMAKRLEEALQREEALALTARDKFRERFPMTARALAAPYNGKRSSIPGIPDLDPYAAMAEHMHGTAPSDTVDVTDVPDLPPHRFAVFNKGREWAYGRGLEINPSHIPAMLDAMEGDGWHLSAVIGQEAPKLGMLFYRRAPSAFELAHGVGGSFERGTSTTAAEESDNMRAWREGKPLSDIDMGRGCEP